MANINPANGKEHIVHDHIEQILFTEDDIASAVADMGRAITNDYAPYVEAGQQIVLICVLRGAAIFMADLARKIDLPLEMDYMVISSYGNGMKSSGMVRIQKDLSADIEGKHVIIAEDVIDSGLTLSYLQKNLLARHPQSLRVAALVKKNNAKDQHVDYQYLGFECPDAFIVGYGLDYAQRYRNLPYIGILKPEIYEQR